MADFLNDPAPLFGFCVVSGVIVTLCAWAMLAKWTAPVLPGHGVNLAAVIFICAVVVVLTSLLLVDALAEGVAYDMGRRSHRAHLASRSPVAFWLLVAMYYVFAVGSFSAGLVVAIKLLRSPDDPGPVRKKPAPPDMDPESEPPAKRFENVWRYANIIYVAALLLPALYVYSTGDWPAMPPHRAIALAFAPFMVSLGLLEIYTGQARVEATVHTRTGTPGKYWLQVGVWLALGVVLFLIGLGVIAA